MTEAGSHPSAKFSCARELLGAQFVGHARRGKYLLFDLDDGRQLVVHLGMTGKLQIVDQPLGDDTHRRAWWLLDDGRALDFVDVRRFGRLYVADDGDYTALPTLHHAGPEPWDPALTDRRFYELLGRSNRPLKTKLLSQRPIAGVGNIYADEALWRARIHPKNRRLSLARSATLLEAIQFVLQQGIDNGGTTLRDYRDGAGRRGSNQDSLMAYGRSGEGCSRCGTLFRNTAIDSRSTTWCPTCQTR